MFACSCGRPFGSAEALASHQLAKGRVGDASFTCPSSHNQAHRQGWLRKDVRKHKVVYTISLERLQPTSTPVSSTLPCKLLCSYSWKNSREPRIQVPGLAPAWQRLHLPVTLPRDSGTYFVDQNAARSPQFQYEPLCRAVTVINPGFRFDDVDVVVSRSSLRHLLDLCAFGFAQKSFRINLLLVNNTLFVERCERNTREQLSGPHITNWGHTFERAFTKDAPGMEDFAGHHQALCYPLGNLRCVVRYELDARYESVSDEKGGSAARDMSGLGQKSVALGRGSSGIPSSMKGKSIEHRTPSPNSISPAGFPPDPTAAEIKTMSKFRSVETYMPQLWFGRTPWLIRGRHTKGTFNEIDISNVAPQFGEWETKNQAALRKLVKMLTTLRETVKHEGRNCVAIYERDSMSQRLRIFASAASRRPLPDDLIHTLWVPGNNDVASNPF